MFYGKSHIINDVSARRARGRDRRAARPQRGRQVDAAQELHRHCAAAHGTIDLTASELPACRRAEIARLGIGYVPQGRGLFAGMSVRRQPGARPSARRTGPGVHWDEDRSSSSSRACGAPGHPGRLSFRRRAADGRGCAGPVGDVRVLLLDEPFEGLSPAVIEELFDAVRPAAPGGLDHHRRAQSRPRAGPVRPHLCAGARARGASGSEPAAPGRPGVPARGPLAVRSNP